MRSMILVVAALLGTISAQASECSQSALEIAQQLQLGRADIVAACEVRQVIAAQARHADVKVASCEAGSVKLVEEKIVSVVQNRDGNFLRSKVTVMNAGQLQTAESYVVTGRLDVNGDCEVTAVKLSSSDDGALSEEP